MTTVATAWQYTVGQLPYQVTAYERLAKGGVVYLRWRAATKHGRNWRHKSLQFVLRDERGRVMRDAEQRAQGEAAKQLAALITGLPKTEAAPRLTIRQGRDLAFEAQTGKYPTNTPHRREVDRALAFAIAILGEDRTWDSIRKADLRRLWRVRIEQIRKKQKAGLRGAEVLVSRILTIAEWLRSEDMIPSTACIASKHWKQELAADWRELTKAEADYEPARPRHTQMQLRKLLEVAPRVDPRFALVLALGAELRLGQVVRARRADLDLGAGTFAVRRRGKKRGTIVKLTAGQLAAARAAVGPAGYLMQLEAQGGDYPLFPQGQLAGGRKGEDPKAVERHRAASPLNRRTLIAWFKAAESLAKIPHVVGRGAYGLRRASVDGAKAQGISREALKEHGGWTDSQMPDQVYADQEADYARDEARDVRAKIRGET